MNKSEIIVVTGANGAIGQAVVKQLEEDGFDVWGVDLVGLDLVRQYDVSKPDDVDALAREVHAAGLTVRGLVNVAGRPGEFSLLGMCADDWDNVFAVNVRSAALLIGRLLPMMSEGSSIVNFGSLASDKGVAERSAYCASKAAVMGLTRAAAVELAPIGIRVNAVNPGTIDTPWIRRLINEAEDPESCEKVIANRAPAARMGQTHEVASVVSYLISDASSFVTGSILPVDGGATAW